MRAHQMTDLVSLMFPAVNFASASTAHRDALSHAGGRGQDGHGRPFEDSISIRWVFSPLRENDSASAGLTVRSRPPLRRGDQDDDLLIEAEASPELCQAKATSALPTSEPPEPLDYPKGLYPSASAMARDHNFRLKDYIAKSTKPKDLVFILHGNPINQILFTLKPVQGGGGHCP